MNTQKLSAYIIGAIFATECLLGLGFVLGANAYTITMAVILICLSIAFGLLTANPLGVQGLVAGICMLLLPSKVIGVLFICIGIAGAIVNLVISQKQVAK